MKVDHDTSSIEFIELVFQAFWSFVLLFGVCELGEMVSNQFTRVNDFFDRCKWYLLPNNIQHMYALILLNAQHPLVFRAYGNLPCTRESFKGVCSCHLQLNKCEKSKIAEHNQVNFFADLTHFRRCEPVSPISWRSANSKIECDWDGDSTLKWVY